MVGARQSEFGKLAALAKDFGLLVENGACRARFRLAVGRDSGPPGGVVRPRTFRPRAPDRLWPARSVSRERGTLRLQSVFRLQGGNQAVEPLYARVDGLAACGGVLLLEARSVRVSGRSAGAAYRAARASTFCPCESVSLALMVSKSSPLCTKSPSRTCRPTIVPPRGGQDAGDTVLRHQKPDHVFLARIAAERQETGTRRHAGSEEQGEDGVSAGGIGSEMSPQIVVRWCSIASARNKGVGHDPRLLAVPRPGRLPERG